MTGSPTIDPVPTNEPRPFWSVMIPTCNPHPDYFAQTLAAVLAEDPGPDAMEIAVIDDASNSVDAREVVRTLGGDRVSWFRQDARVGIGRNWNTCIQRARGRWVQILHQDDLVLPGFYARLGDGVSGCPAAGAAFCRDAVIDGNGRRMSSQPRLRDTAGILEDWIEHVFVGLHLRASALVVERRVYETLGGFRLDLGYALDWDMWKRIAAAYPLWYEPDTLACYRRHSGSESNTFIRSGGNVAEIRRSIDLSEGVLPPAIARDVSRRARQNYTKYAVGMAWRALTERQLSSCLAQIREARKLTSWSYVLRSAFARLLSASSRVLRDVAMFIRM